MVVTDLALARIAFALNMTGKLLLFLVSKCGITLCSATLISYGLVFI